MTRSLRVFLTLTISCASLGATSMSSADPSAARAVLDEAAAELAKAGSFRLEAHVVYSGKYSDSEETMATDYRIAANKEGDVGVRVKNETLEIHLFSSGDDFVRYMPEFAQYMTQARDLTVAELMEQASFEIIDPVVDVLSAFAQFKSPADGFVLRDLAFVGNEPVAGVSCDRIQFSLGGRMYDLWIEQGPARLVRRIQPDMTDLEQKYKSEYQMEFDITVAADIPVWEINADVSSAVRFTPPDGAEEVERFGPKSPAEKLAGTTAPDFTLPLLDGGEFTLSKARGSIVILDFWATWCGPCRIAMPVLSEVSREFAGKGVELISIDLEEDAADVKAFLADMGLKVTVALDGDSSVARAYQVSGIPQTVIVGRNGIIQKVHVGLWAMPELSPDDSQEQQMSKTNAALADALRAELNELLKASLVQ